MRPLLLIAVLGVACTVQSQQPNLKGQDVRLTVIHTADIHSRLFPYRFSPGRTDQNYGLALGQGPYGGMPRIGWIIKDIRAHSARSIWLDSGDAFQGAPVFNEFHGEVEFRSLSLLGLDGAVVGNHEFDQGANNLYEQIVNWADFPLLAANYAFDDPKTPNAPKLGQVVEPYQIYDVDGVIVGVIGMAAEQSILSLYEGGNSAGVRPLDNDETMRSYVAMLRPACDLIVVLSHLGLDQDEGLAPNEVTDDNENMPLDGVDLILGGHLHIVLNPPKIQQIDRNGFPTLLVHSGAFAKYVGRLDLVVHIGDDNNDPAKRSHITAFSYDNLPVTCGYRAHPDTDPCPNPVDPETLAMLQPYSVQLNQDIDLHGVFAYANIAAGDKIMRSDTTGGDSQLGNLVARSMQLTEGVDADFAVTNSLGIRTDFEQGPIDHEALYNVFPFENTIVIMYLSGNEVKEMLDFNARKSSERGCRSQIQVAGLAFTMVCGSDPRAEDIYVGEKCRMADGVSIDTSKCTPVIPEGLYRVAVNDYIAAGGSGFSVLKRNTSKFNTGIPLRAGLMDYVRGLTGNKCPADLVDIANSSTPQPKVVDEYGNITCLDTNTEPHDARIISRAE